MSDTHYLDGFIYHMVHYDNLRGIFQRRAILSKRRVEEENLSYRTIANDEVQDIRDRIYVWDFTKRRYRSLHSYVPFYFATRTPMLHNKFTEGTQDKVCIFEVSRGILRDEGVIFTDGNASNQQLSKYREEKVGIMPATISRECQRRYHPGGPFGMNASRSNFFADVKFLERLDWNIIDDRATLEDKRERTRIKHAEVLIPDLLPLGRVQEIAVKTREMVVKVNALIGEAGLTGRIPTPVCKPWLYF